MKSGILSAVVLVSGAFAWAEDVGTAFTYRGTLERESGPALTSCDFEFSLWDALESGTQIGLLQAPLEVEIRGGSFAVKLDFGPGAFADEARWLEIHVKCPPDADFTMLTPRQELTPTPAAITSGSAGKARGLGADFAQTVNQSEPGMRLHQDGAGPTMALKRNSAGDPDVPALEAISEGDGPAGKFHASSGANSAPAVSASHDGTGPAIKATGMGGGPALDAESQGSGPAARLKRPKGGTQNVAVLDVINESDGPAAALNTSDATATSSTLQVSNSGQGQAVQAASTGAMPTIEAENSNTDGVGICAKTLSPTGETMAVEAENISNAGIGVLAKATASTGMTKGILAEAVSPEGHAGYFLGRGYFSDRVGIGVDDPMGALHVKDDESSESEPSLLIDSSSNQGTWFSLRNNVSGKEWNIVADASGGPGGGHLRFQDGSQRRLVIDGSGKVAIAKNTPGSTLDVNGQCTMTGFRLTTGATNGYVLTSDSSGIGTWQAAGAGSGWSLTGNAGTNSLSNFLGTTDAQGLSLKTNGSTRISIGAAGTVTLTTSLDLQQPATIASGQRIQAQIDGGARILGSQGDTPATPAIGFFSTNGVDDGGGGNGIYRPLANVMAFATASTERMRINSTGQIGMGRTATTNRLEVEGDASKTVAGDWLANSDRSIKTQVRMIDNALQTIERLRPVAFRYTDEYKAKHPSIDDHDYYNFIAQEFREVFPQAVQDSGENGLLQMDSYPATVYAVAAIQELHELVLAKDCELSDMRDRNDREQAELRSEISDLKSQISELKTLVTSLTSQSAGGEK